VVTRVTGDKKAARNAQKAFVAAGLQASKELKKRQQEQAKKGKGWLIVGIIAAAVTAGVAAWRASKPVEDPWRTPAPVTQTPASPSTSATSPATTPVTETTATTTASTTTASTTEAGTSGPDLTAASEQAKAANKKVKDAPVDLSDTAKHAAKPNDATS
jgi:cytoskeletal protein RodZ